jgi:hypothetical protein
MAHRDSADQRSKQKLKQMSLGAGERRRGIVADLPSMANSAFPRVTSHHILLLWELEVAGSNSDAPIARSRAAGEQVNASENPIKNRLSRAKI